MLFRSMRLPPGSDPDKAIIGYVTALQGLPAEAISRGIQRFLRGECEEVSPKFCPYPPELAKICRTTRYATSPSPEPRGFVPAEMPGFRERMRLKMPLYSYAERHGLMADLAAANREGFGAMVNLATKWGIEVPPELLGRHDAEDEWRRARNRIWVELERNPPPFMRSKKWQPEMGA